MPLEKLLSAIQEEARAEAQNIREQAQAEAQSIIEDTTARTRLETDNLKQERIRACRKRVEQQISQARLSARRQTLEVQQELVDNVFASALLLASELDDEHYRDWVRKKILEICRADDETVVFSERDRKRLPPEWLAETSELLQKEGYPGPFRFTFQEADTSGGFLVRSPKYEIRVTFEELLEGLRESMRARIADILFTD